MKELSKHINRGGNPPVAIASWESKNVGQSLDFIFKANEDSFNATWPTKLKIADGISEALAALMIPEVDYSAEGAPGVRVEYDNNGSSNAVQNRVFAETEIDMPTFRLMLKHYGSSRPMNYVTVQFEGTSLGWSQSEYKPETGVVGQMSLESSVYNRDALEGLFMRTVPLECHAGIPAILDVAGVILDSESIYTES